MGAAVLPSFALEPEDAAITALDVADVPLIQRLGLFWHRERVMVAAAETLREVTIEVCASSQSRHSKTTPPAGEPVISRAARRGVLTPMPGADAGDNDPGDGVAEAS
jgi:hypothetical protein